MNKLELISCICMISASVILFVFIVSVISLVTYSEYTRSQCLDRGFDGSISTMFFEHYCVEDLNKNTVNYE